MTNGLVLAWVGSGAGAQVPELPLVMKKKLKAVGDVDKDHGSMLQFNSMAGRM